MRRPPRGVISRAGAAEGGKEVVAPPGRLARAHRDAKEVWAQLTGRVLPAPGNYWFASASFKARSVFRPATPSGVTFASR